MAWVSDSVQRRSICRRCSKELPSLPPQTIISLPVHTAVCKSRRSGRVGGAGGCPTVRAGIVSPAGVQSRRHSLRPRRSFHCPSTLLCDCIGQRARWWCWWLSNCRCWDCIFRRCSNGAAVASAPDDHFAAGPHCRVTVSASGRVGGAGGCPTVRAGIVPPAGVRKSCRHHPPQTIISLPVHTAV